MDSNLNESLQQNTMNKNNLMNASAHPQPEISRYMSMKSNRYQLNSILNEYQRKNETSDNKNYENKLPNGLTQSRNQQMHKSNSSYDVTKRVRRDQNSLLNACSLFRKMTGMTNNDHFNKALSPDRDRLNSVADIEGSSSYNRQLSTNQPLKLNYDK